MGDSIRIATLNCRNTADRWSRRRVLLARQLRALSPDIIGLQELRRWPSQGRWIARNAAADSDEDPDDPYTLTTAWKGGIWKWAWEGIGTLSRLDVLDSAQRALGDDRVAQRTTVRLPSGAELDVYNTHLHHPPLAHVRRTAEARRLLAWIARRAGTPHIVLGDLNGEFDSPEVRSLRDGGLRSVFSAAGLAEPAQTFPAPASRGWGGPGKTIDFILVSAGISVQAARLAFADPDEADERLSASDHYGLVAEITIEPGASTPK